MDDKCGIGKDNKLPWKIKQDMEFFKKVTTGNVVIMGRKTWESIPKKFRPLPNRTNIILTRNKNYNPGNGAECFDNLNDAVQKYKDEQIYVIGGAEIYRMALQHKDCEGLVITRVKGDFQCDTFFNEMKYIPFEYELIYESPIFTEKELFNFEYYSRDQDKYSIEPHGKGHALYFGRGPMKHGLRLCNMEDFDSNGEETRSMIVEALNEKYVKPPAGSGLEDILKLKG